MVDIRIISLGAGTKYIIKSQVRHWTVTITHTGGCGSKCRVQVGISMWEKWFGWYSTVRMLNQGPLIESSTIRGHP